MPPMKEHMQITSQVFQVGGNEYSAQRDAAIYLITDENESVLIDAGTGDGHETVLKNIENCGVNIKSINTLFLTHCHYDHIGGASRLRDATGCRLVSHEQDARYLEAGDPEVTAASWYRAHIDPLPIDEQIREKEASYIVGRSTLTVYHIPGHSPGSTALTIHSDGKLILFGQDIHGPLNEVLLSNRQDYERSLEFLISLNADILCEGHFGIYSGKESVSSFIESFL